jgi:cytochrome b6-f complex iron-sulfur subunit
VITAGKLDDIKNQINQTNQPFYFGAGRFYLVPYSGSGQDPATGVDYVSQGVVAEGLMPLYQRCAHLGCRVPFCLSSKWFECPCHGSKYNEAGEWQLGPAPTGMQRFKISVTGGDVMVDTSDVSTPGPPRGTDTIHEPPQGPFCVAPG